MNPFVGLRPYTQNESLLFFGRREQTVELLERLHESRFLGVVGSSGCGKSSLIRAGLIPSLQAGFLIESRDRWRIAELKPGAGPIENLALGILDALNSHAPDADDGGGRPPAGGADEDGRAVDQASVLWEEIRVRGAAAVLDRLRPVLEDDDASLLLLVDQFEELFRFRSEGDVHENREVAAEFVQVILDLARQRELPVFVVLTMRSDFLGELASFRGLPEAMNRSQYLVPRLTRTQRRQSIEGPIRLFGGSVGSRFVDHLLNDSVGEADQLPVMQHLLMRAWTNRQKKGGGAIDDSDYDDVGGVERALSDHADEAMLGMTPAEETLTRAVFQALTMIDAEHRRVRRPRLLSKLVEETGADREAILRIVERFEGGGRSFLFRYEDPTRDDTLIDISHESLIRRWTILKRWVDEEAEEAGVFVRLTDEAVVWDEESGPVRRGKRLVDTEAWWARRLPSKGWASRYHGGYAVAKKFIEASVEARKKRRVLIGVGVVAGLALFGWQATIIYRNAALGARIAGLEIENVTALSLLDERDGALAAAQESEEAARAAARRADLQSVVADSARYEAEVLRVFTSIERDTALAEIERLERDGAVLERTIRALQDSIRSLQGTGGPDSTDLAQQADTLLAALQGFRCDPTAIRAAVTGRMGYQRREDRCEGFYAVSVQQDVDGASELADQFVGWEGPVVERAGEPWALVGFYESFDELNPEAHDRAVLSWVGPPSRAEVEITAQSVSRAKQPYRMDTQVRGNGNAFAWSTELLRSARLVGTDLSILASMDEGSAPLVLGLRISADTAGPDTERVLGKFVERERPAYRAVVLPTVGLEGVSVSIARVSEAGRRSTRFVREDEPLRTRFLSYRPFEVVIDDVAEEGIYMVRLHGRLYGGTPESLYFWFYHPGF